LYLIHFPEFQSYAGLIIAVVAINVAIGLAQEGKAEKAAEAIKAMLSSTANVMRAGKKYSLDADQLVPGDIVYVKSGDKIPADMRMVEVTNLQVLEAMLTGESNPISKNLIPVVEGSALGDRKCMCFSATTVSAGQGVGVITATGKFFFGLSSSPVGCAVNILGTHFTVVTQ
jgi:P-type E1-E2 ATPase